MSRGTGTLEADSGELARAVGFVRSGNFDAAISIYIEEVARTELPAPGLCLQLARCYAQKGDPAEVFRWASAVVDGNGDYVSWQAAAQLISSALDVGLPGIRREARIAVLGSSTTAHFVPLLRLAAARYGIALEIHEAAYGQYQQELLDPNSHSCQFEPALILLAVDSSALRLPAYSHQPDKTVDQELSRWTQLWRQATQLTGARVVQFNFPVPPEEPLGHLSVKLRGARSSMIGELNRELGTAAGSDVTLVDCERLSATVGRQRWFDPRYWMLAKEAVAPEVLPVLARHTAGVIAGVMGMNRKCLVLDLDNTLWGGIIGEDGMEGIRLGQGGDGEAFVAFQEYLLSLKNKGVILVVCSKNNEQDARQPFVEHPEMRLKLDDIAMFVANWQNKSDNLRTISRDLNIGLDSLVFVDDNPAERQAVRALMPEVDVIALPADPAYYVRVLSEYPLLETNTLTREDAQKTEQYRARAQSIQIQNSTESLESFYEDLRMEAIVAPFDEFHVPRIVQLIGKTNQFNLTGRRHSAAEVRVFMNDSSVAAFYVRLRDRFADHGLVSVMIARRDDTALNIDTWLMSCRVIGRTVESLMLSHICRLARARECTQLRGVYVQSSKNELVKSIYPGFGFEKEGEDNGAMYYIYDVQKNGDIANEYIRVIDNAA